MGLLEGKVCVITGGAGSIGLATAKLFHAEGAKVVIVDLHQAQVDAAARALGGNAMGCAGDVTDAAFVETFFDAAIAKWGSLDVAFSNAGNPGHIATLDEYDDDAFDFTMRVHGRGAYLVCKHAGRRMKAGGSIVVTSSLAGVRGGAGQNTAYVAAKHAQIGIVKAAARALAGRGIRVNAVNPGPIDNSFQKGIEDGMSSISGVDVTAELDRNIPLKRHGRPEEVAKLALFLASPMSSYITGTVNLIDGGLMS